MIDALNEQLDSRFYYRSPESDAKCMHTIIRLAPKGFDTAFLHVDVFFLMALSKDAEEAKKQREEISRLAILYKAKKFSPFSCGIITRKELNLMLRTKIKGLGTKSTDIWDRYLHEAGRVKFDQGDLCCSADRFSDWYDFPTEMMKKTEEIELDGWKFKIPSDYDEILKTQYGDYMKPPSLEARIAEVKRHYYYLTKNCPL